MKLGETDLFPNVNLGFLVGPSISTRWDRCARVRAKPHLGETDHINSARPISVISKQRLGQANSMGPIAHFGQTKTLRRERESLQSHLSETEIPISKTELIRVSGYGYVKWTRWHRIDQIDGAEFDFRFWTNVEMRKGVRVFGAISLSTLSK